MEVEYREDLDRSVELTEDFQIQLRSKINWFNFILNPEEEFLRLEKSIADGTWSAYLKIYREQGELKAGNWLWEQMLD